MKKIADLERTYDLQLNKIAEAIKIKNAKKVLLQFPDMLKPFSTEIVDYLEEKTSNKTTFFIWFGTCFGACDTPILPEKTKNSFDLIIQFGHNELLPNF